MKKKKENEKVQLRRVEKRNALAKIREGVQEGENAKSASQTLRDKALTIV